MTETQTDSVYRLIKNSVFKFKKATLLFIKISLQKFFMICYINYEYVF